MHEATVYHWRWRARAFCRKIAETCGYEIIDFLDDKASNTVGKINEVSFHASNYDGVIVAIGNNTMRRNIAKSWKESKDSTSFCLDPSNLFCFQIRNHWKRRYN